jgi:hypothetical protein
VFGHGLTGSKAHGLDSFGPNMQASLSSQMGCDLFFNCPIFIYLHFIIALTLNKFIKIIFK